MMKHTHSATPSLAGDEEFDSIEVITNNNTANVDDEEISHERENSHEREKVSHNERAIEANELDVVIPNENRETNGMHNNGNNRAQPGKLDHENYAMPSQPKTNNNSEVTVNHAKHYSPSIIPRIFMVLLIILLIAVIALAFVLYHLDSELSDTKAKVNVNSQGVGSLKDNSTLLSQITHKIQSNKEKIQTNNLSISKNKDGVAQVAKRTDINNSTILKMRNAFKKDVSRLSIDSNELNETMSQLDMYIQYMDRFRGKIGMSFSDVLKLSKRKDKVNREAVELQKLQYQYDQFTDKYKVKWGINYTDILRLTDALNFKVDQPIPLLENIDWFCEVFKKQFKKKWSIKFNDVMRLTTVSDVKTIGYLRWLLAGNIVVKANATTPKLLKKIDYMYKRFTSTYQQKWGIDFKDVIALTDKINFEVNGSIAILEDMRTWYVSGFKEIWGNSFAGIVHIMIGLKEPQRKAIVGKLTSITSRDKILKFLPGTFGYSNGRLDVYGFIAIYRDPAWETIQQLINGNKDAQIVCKTGGYGGGVYDNGAYRKGGTVDRSALGFWAKAVMCKGNETKVDDCWFTPGSKDLKHSDDTGIKCFF